jgi:hypothetical protein
MSSEARQRYHNTASKTRGATAVPVLRAAAGEHINHNVTDGVRHAKNPLSAPCSHGARRPLQLCVTAPLGIGSSWKQCAVCSENTAADTVLTLQDTHQQCSPRNCIGHVHAHTAAGALTEGQP